VRHFLRCFRFLFFGGAGFDHKHFWASRPRRRKTKNKLVFWLEGYQQATPPGF
jgi:hypothetical protein